MALPEGQVQEPHGAQAPGRLKSQAPRPEKRYLDCNYHKHISEKMLDFSFMT